MAFGTSAAASSLIVENVCDKIYAKRSGKMRDARMKFTYRDEN